MRTSLSQQPYALPQSRVPSLISDRSSLRLSGNLGTPVRDNTASGFVYASDMSPMSPQWPLPDDMFHAPPACVQDTTMNFPATGQEYPQVYAPDTQYANDASSYQQLQQGKHGVLPAIPSALGLPFLTSAASRSIPPSEGGRGFPFIDTMNQPSLMAEQDPTRDRRQKSRFPCPVYDCSKDFSSTKEFAKHVIADHDKDSTFICKHPACSFRTHRPESWKRHHSKDHGECQVNEECNHEDRPRVKRHWACGLCINLEVCVQGFANHYKSHFECGNVQKSDIRISNIIRSLLTQDATRARWEELDVDRPRQDGLFVLCWDGKDVAEIREALEYETFRASTLDSPDVVDALLHEVLVCGTRRA
ncbi:hypothetical protein CLAIMM_04213 [Cladophialophora immunda]|nr:hypothetical protein CLAIMM_04213 [Cladophialophora immunda]